ncbi:MAG TPA: gephyrin-like molybdotransferase Glp [Acidimicrobiia bacterium]|nr:gephyrin-like molybdotransferase Glp [Acidimicrobiia bacterium]
MEALADAQRRIVDAVRPLAPRELAIRDAHGLVLAQEVAAIEPVPPFANTAMDGYAVRAVDTDGASPTTPVRLRVVDELPAGRAPSVPVDTGEAIRIMTGAPVPPGADAIVMVERTEVDGDAVLVREPARRGDHVRPVGGDVGAGAVVFGPGAVLGAAHIGVLASLGVETVLAHPTARVGVLSTGDELVESGPLAPGQIRDSNRAMLLALVAENGAVPVDLGLARDDEAAITSAITAGLESCDALLTTGGVSVGDFDYVKVVLERLASERPDSGFVWSQVAIKPAKPLAFGTIGGVPVFGLPGNPVSSHVSFELFARPALRRMTGHRHWFRPELTAVAADDLTRRRDGKLHLDRVRVWSDRGRLVCARSGAQGSNVLSAMAAANGLALLDDGEGVERGGSVRVLLLGEPFTS